MTDRGKEPVREETRTIDMLWASQDKVNQRIDELAADIQKLAVEVRRGFNPNPARAPLNFHREERPANRLPPRRRNAIGNQGRYIPRNQAEPIDSGEETPPRRGYLNPAWSSGEETDEGWTLNDQRRRRVPQFQQTAGEFKVKLDIPFFDGHLHIEDYLDWERAAENFFDYMEIPPEKQVKYVACRLKGGASAWWEQILQSRRREGRSRISDWGKMKQLLRAQFLPTDFEQILYMRYQHCVQGPRTVSEYTEEFNRLTARNDLQESGTQLVARYIGGLKESIQDKLELNTVWTMPQAVNLAMKVEVQ
ncbi:hypothetical protein MA16_Dca024582 [Dendrobium catenatum]|uniref:Retrotransposon gag domain-containing protein n=1 Tax=Dendrobium catenatum TaxID=906689 RepID=A0A2I0WWV0_9ASPA|nr:hypothetical protein MA16_Dca024582 [Dendrobium catenatum]